jgi:hypothetical protein
MSGKWSQPNVPHRGWSYVDYEDLGQPLETCEMCERQEIRHVHIVSHPDYPSTLRVGCDCAEKLTGDYSTPTERERSHKNWLARLNRFLTKGWEAGRYGSLYRRWKGRSLLVAPKGAGWIAKAEDEGGRKTFVSVVDAKRALFHFFDPPP